MTKWFKYNLFLENKGCSGFSPKRPSLYSWLMRVSKYQQKKRHGGLCETEKQKPMGK